MLKKTKELLPLFNAKFIITGEIVGQRPMSQRKDSMNTIIRESDTRDILLRPLCAKNLPPTKIEEQGIVDRSKLLDLMGRSRKRQLELAKKIKNRKKIPTPAGGCLLTDPEMARRYRPILENKTNLLSEDFYLAKVGRQFWSNRFWLVVGRNHSENLKLLKLARESDYVFKLSEIPGPIGIGRSEEVTWSGELIKSAAQIIIWYSRARELSSAVKLQVCRKKIWWKS